MNTKQAVIATLRGGREAEAYIEAVVRRVWNVSAVEYDSAVDELVASGDVVESYRDYDDMRVGFLELRQEGENQ